MGLEVNLSKTFIGPIDICMNQLCITIYLTLFLCVEMYLVGCGYGPYPGLTRYEFQHFSASQMLLPRALTGNKCNKSTHHSTIKYMYKEKVIT
jgi:hypothetical protein